MCWSAGSLLIGIFLGISFLAAYLLYEYFFIVRLNKGVRDS